MITTKIYNERLDLKDVNLIYKSKNNACMQKLENNYKGRCHGGAHIIDIEEIINVSDVEISRDHTDCRATVCVVFRANVIQMQENDLISRCKIIKSKGERTFAEANHSNVILSKHNLLKIVDKGDKIPIIILKIKYTNKKNKISIYAMPYTPNVPIKNYIYILTESMTELEIEKINTYLKKIEELRNWKKSLIPKDKKKFDAFDDLFYPFTIIKKPTLLLNKKISSLDITNIDFKSFKNSIIIPCSEIIQSKPFVLKANISDFPNAKNIWEVSDIQKELKKKKNKSHISEYIYIEERAYVIFELLFVKHIKYLLFMKNIIKDYDMPTSTNIYWKNMRDYKH